MATIKDIAREAGVSQGTVSNVINKTGKVSTEKIRLVEEAIARLGYVPNVQASLLRQGASNVIAVILPNLKESAYLDFYLAVQATLQPAGYDAQIYTTNDADAIEADILEKVRVSGILAVLTVSTLSPRCCELYSGFPRPVIYIERQPDRLRPQDAFYGFDDAGIAQDWAEYLSGCSWKRIAFFCAPNQHLITPRLAAAMDATAKKCDISLTHFSADYNFSLPKAFDIVQTEPGFDAVICVGSLRTASIETVFSVCKMESRPTLISIGSESPYLSASHMLYELDYRQLASQASKALIARETEEIELPRQTLLPPSGFPYQFPQITQGNHATISMLTLDNPSTGALKKLLPMFQAISGIKLELTCVPYEELHAQLESLSQKCPYDLIRIDVADFQPLGKTLYTPLTQAFRNEGLPSQLSDGIYERYSMIDETPYALPFDPSVQLFLYRKDLFSNALLRRSYYEEYRENLEVPTTFEQYLRIARFFTQAMNPGSPTLYGGTTTCGSDATLASEFLPYYLDIADTIAENGRLKPLNSPQTVEAMSRFRDMQKYTCRQQWWRDSLRQFAAGNAATAVVYSNYISDVINTKHSSVVGQVGTAMLPGGHPLLGGGVIGISRFSKQVEACKQFLTWFYSDDIASMLVRLGGTSPLASAYKDFTNFSIYPWLSVARESTVRGTRGSDGAAIPGFTIRRFEFAIGTAVQKMIFESLPPDHAAVIAQTLYDYRNPE